MSRIDLIVMGSHKRKNVANVAGYEEKVATFENIFDVIMVISPNRKEQQIQS